MSGMQMVIENGIVLTPGGEISQGVVLLNGSKIADVGKQSEVQIPQGAVRFDAKGGFIAPGFIDIHLHGGMGADVTEGTPEVFKTMSLFFAKHGVSSFVASVLTVPDETIFKVLDTVRELMSKNDLPGARLLGVHLEGPYLNVRQKGAHPKDLLRNPDPEHYLPLLEYADVIRMVTLAPELHGARNFVEELNKRNIVAAAGHTDAIDREMLPVVDAGMTHSTHMFCNMSHFRRDQLMRTGGATETILYDERITTEIIADGFHLSPLLLKLAVKVKGVDNVCFVTDAMPAAGMPDGTYFIGGVEAEVKNGAARLPDYSAYAGSVATMDVCVKNGMDQMDLSPSEAVRMASSTPARIIGVNKGMGSLEKGKDADIVILDKNFKVQKTIVKGKPV